MALSVKPISTNTLGPTINAAPPTLAGVTSVKTPTLTTAAAPVPYAAPSTTSTTQPPIDYSALLKSTISNQQAIAPKLDYAAISAQARASAQNAVNPFYTKSLHDFLTQQASQRAQQQAAVDTAIKGYEQNFANTQAQNQVTGDRATQDEATNIGQINTNADQFQTDSGTAFDQARLAEAQRAAGGSGLSAQGGEALQAANATSESRTGAQTQEQVQNQRLAKARTFEDLARIGELAAQTKEKGIGAAKVDLANFIENQGFDVQNEKQQLEQQRLAAVASEQQNQSKLLLNQFLSKISNPAQYQAAVNAYGNIF